MSFTRNWLLVAVSRPEFFYQKFLTLHGLPRGACQKITPRQCASLYSNDQLRDGMNTFLSRITNVQGSDSPLCFDRLGSGPLEHAFGQARIRCHDVNTMKKMLSVFAYRAESISLQPFLELSGTRHHKRSIGIICDPWQQSPASVLSTKAFHIVVSLLQQIGMDLTSLQLMDEASDCYPGWWDLQTLREFLDPLRGTVLKETVFISFFSFLDPKSVDNRQSERWKVLSSD
jgi:hypothetical protein